jgi:ribosomal protein L40E
MAKKKLGYVELHWTCPNCGTMNPGSERVCRGCGSPQPDDVEFEQAERQELITDEEDIAKAKAGADVHCGYCGARNPAGTTVCTQCQADLSEGAKRKAGRVVGAFKTGPATKVTCPNCGAENPDTALSCSACGGSLQRKEGVKEADKVESKVDKPKPKPWVSAVLIAGMVVICVVVVIIVVLSMQTTAVAGVVQDVSWERTIGIEALMPVEYNDWFDLISTDAEVGACDQQVRSIEDSPSANSEEVCGTPYTVDKGDGFAEVVQDCEYHVYDDFCTYTVEEWQQVDESVLEGYDTNPIWPEPVLYEGQQIGSEREESYTIVFDAGGETYAFTTTDSELFQQCQIGSTWNLNINTFNTVVSIEQ